MPPAKPSQPGNRPTTRSGHVLEPRPDNGARNDNGAPRSSAPRASAPRTPPARPTNGNNNPRSPAPRSHAANWWDSQPGDPMSVAADLHRLADRIHPGPMDSSRSSAAHQGATDSRNTPVKKTAAKPATKTASKMTIKASPNANGRASQANKTRSR